MMFMSSEVYGMMDELGELVQAVKERERPLHGELPEDIERLAAFMNAIIEIFTEAAEVVAEAWREMRSAILEAAQVVKVVIDCITPFVEQYRRGQVFQWIRPYVGKRAAWYLATRWPRRWLPRWSIE